MTTLFYPTKHREAQNGAAVLQKEPRAGYRIFFGTKVNKTSECEPVFSFVPNKTLLVTRKPSYR
jgi:hypothetical protein